MSINLVEARKDMRQWFFEIYMDPANGVMHVSEEGGYLYMNGGPYDPLEELMAQFEGEYPTALIEDVAQDIASEGGHEWVKRDEY